MTSDNLYELAFRYKKTKLWKHLTDTQVFAVKTDKETLFISVMGGLNEHIALAVYQHICGIAYHIEGALNCSLLVFRQIVMNHVVALDVMLVYRLLPLVHRTTVGQIHHCIILYFFSRNRTNS